MAIEVAKLAAVLSAETADFHRELDHAEGHFKKVGSALKYAAIGAGVAIAGGLAVGIDKSVEAAVAAQASQARLAKAFQAAGLSAAKYRKEIEATEKAGRKRGFTDTETRQSLGSLIISTGSATKSVRELAIAQDLARFKGVGLEQSTKALTMANAGSLRAIKQLGIDIPKVTKAQDAVREAYKKHTGAAYDNAIAQAKVADKAATVASVMDVVSQKVHGQADAYSKTAAGGMAVFHANLESLEANIGTLLLPALSAITAEANKVVTWIQANLPTIKKVAAQIFGDISVAWNTVLKPVLIGIIGATVLTVRAVEREWPKIRAAAEAVIQWYDQNLKPTITAVLGYLRSFWARWGDDITSITRRVFGTLAAIVKPLLTVIRDAIQVVLALIRGDWGKAWDSLKDLLRNALRAQVAIVKGIGSAIVDAAKSLGGEIVRGIIAGIKDAPSIGKALIDKIKGPSGLDIVKSVFRIHSPSKLTADEIGRPLADGIAQGILDGSIAISDAMVTAVGNAVEGARGRVGSAFGDFSSMLGTVFNTKISTQQTPTERLIAKREDARQRASLAAGVTSAKSGLATAQASGDPAQVKQAQQALSDAEYQVWLYGAQKKAALERKAYDDYNRVEQLQFDKRLARLQTYLDSGYATAKGARARINGILKDFGVGGAEAGSLLGNEFAAGLRATIPLIIAAIKQLHTAVANQGIITRGRGVTQKKQQQAQAKKSGSGSGGNAGAGGDSYRGYAASQLGSFGWSADQFPALDRLWNIESGWSPSALNKKSGAYGIPQALPAAKMAAQGADWKTNAFTQIMWGLGYIKSRYGSPSNALAHEMKVGWYDRGGILKPGVTLAVNNTGRDEMVVPASGSRFKDGSYGVGGEIIRKLGTWFLRSGGVGHTGARIPLRRDNDAWFEGRFRAGDAYLVSRAQIQDAKQWWRDHAGAIIARSMSFDRGGWLQPGMTLAYNGTGRPERVGGGGDVHFHAGAIQTGAIVTERDLGRYLREIIRRAALDGIDVVPQPRPGL